MIPFDLSELKSIIDIFEEDQGVKLKYVYLDYCDSILVIRGEKVELYVRSIYNNSLVIARIQLNHKHQGVGTKVFNEIIKYAINKGFTKIEVESVMTEEMHEFCNKFGFKEKIDTRFGTICNYEMNL